MEVIPAQIPRRRGPLAPRFTADEDDVIMRAKMVNPSEPWTDIAKRLMGRNGRQCRDRWNHYLSLQHCSKPWTPDEDRFLVEKINELWMIWAEIRPSFEGRSERDIMNRWHSHVKFKTVHDGTKFIYTESGPSFADPDRKECNKRKSYPGEAALSIIQGELGVEASWTLGMNSTRPSVLEPISDPENETNIVWDQMTTDESTDERFLFGQSEL
jgi:hypothetical protein